MERKNVLIVDDHAAMRAGVKGLLNDFYSGLHIYESEDGDSMLQTLKQKKINLVILDVQMTNTDTIGVVELVTIKYPETDILIFSMLPENIYGRRLLKAGVKGFLPKSASIEEMKKAFDLALRSKRYISPSMADQLTLEVIEQSDDPFSRLSHREFAIAHDLLKGCSINLIAQKMNLRPSTVGTYKSRIFEKLHIQTIFQLKDLATLYRFNG